VAIAFSSHVKSCALLHNLNFQLRSSSGSTKLNIYDKNFNKLLPVIGKDSCEQHYYFSAKTQQPHLSRMVQSSIESFASCSHGAGRIMGRKQAQRQLDLKTEIKRLDQQDIIHAIRSKRDLDEAAGAYKDIGMVMKNQDDLVTIVEHLKPLAVIKG
jgi:hypothetical protein